jgi:hypothetical protein
MTRHGSVVLGLVVALTVATPGVASAKAKPAHHFKNCTDMHRTYKGGVAKPGAKDHRKSGGHARHLPYVNAALYAANTSMDRDHDGIACEA